MASTGRFAVIGLGRMGTAIASKLTEKGAEVIAIDSKREHIESIREKVTYAVVLDSTDKEALLSQGIQNMAAVVVSIGDNFQDVRLTTFTLQEIGVKRLIVRAHGETQNKILEKMGVTEILSPEGEVSNNVAENLINPHILMSVKLPDNFEIIEVKAPKGIVDRTLADIGLREKYKINLVTLLRCDGIKGSSCDNQTKDDGHVNHHIIGVPESTTTIYKSDILLLFGTDKNIQRFIEINS